MLRPRLAGLGERSRFLLPWQEKEIVNVGPCVGLEWEWEDSRREDSDIRP